MFHALLSLVWNHIAAVHLIISYDSLSQESVIKHNTLPLLCAVRCLEHWEEAARGFPHICRS